MIWVSLPYHKDSDPDIVGELLLKRVNGLQRYGYETTDFRIQWYRAEVEREKANRLFDLVDDDWKRVQKITDDYEGLDCYLYWDGDGTLLFDYEGLILENPDIKKSTGWRWR